MSLWRIPLLDGAYCYAIRESGIFDRSIPKRGKIRDIYDL